MRGATCAIFMMTFDPDEYKRPRCGYVRSARVGPVLTCSPLKLIKKIGPVVRGWGR